MDGEWLMVRRTYDGWGYSPLDQINPRNVVAVLSGWGQDARLMQTRIDAVSPGNFPEVPEGGVIWVFAVK